jgi:hypothetical protein
VVFVVSATIVPAKAAVLASATVVSTARNVERFLPALLIENFKVAAAVSVTALPTFAETTNLVPTVVTSEVPSAGATVTADDA